MDEELFETSKTRGMDEKYFAYMDELEKMNVPIREVIYNFPLFVGAVNIAS